MLLNLISNALKFTVEGAITIIVDFENEGNMLKITVKDTGIGIKEEDRDKLFRLFGKLEYTADINTSGIGIGLNLCMKIVHALGGTIWLDP